MNMKEQLKNVGDEDLASVRQTCKTLLVSNWCMFKWSTVRGRLKGSKDMFDFACCLLREFGLLRWATWKPDGKTGKAPIYVVRQELPDKQSDLSFYI